MDFLTDWLTNWLKELLIGGIMGNLEGLFDTVNAPVSYTHLKHDKSAGCSLPRP